MLAPARSVGSIADPTLDDLAPSLVDLSRAWGAKAALATGSALALARPSLPQVPTAAKWAWAARGLETETFRLGSADSAASPRPGDLALVGIESVGYHTTITDRENRKLRLYPGDVVVGVFGHRYATDAYEAEVEGLDDLSLLTAGGMIGTIRSRHKEMGRPTTVTFLGYVTDADGHVRNLKDLRFHARRSAAAAADLIVVVGTGMNAGKTTVVSQLVHALHDRGLEVAACKLTGSVSNRDVDEMRAASARDVRDFSDYGFPSTYLASREELLSLAETMLADANDASPDVVVMEIADGLLQRETDLLLREPGFRARTSGVLLAADSALGALAAVDRLHGWGYDLLAVSGAFTSSPLYVQELSRQSPVRIASSAGDGSELGEAVARRLRDRAARPPQGPEGPRKRPALGQVA